MTSLRNIVVEILQSRDFQISDSDGFLFARKGEAEIMFCLFSNERAVIDSFLLKAKSYQGKKVIATLDILPPALLGTFDPSIMVWDREALEHEIGRSRIEKIIGERDHGLVDELTADDYPKMVSKEELENLPDTSIGEKIIRPVMSLADVKEISRQTVAGFRHRLELIPYFVYGYTCSLYSGTEKVSIEKGLLCVNGLTQRVEAWSEQAEVVYTLDINHKRLEPAIDQDEAKKLARKEIVRVNSYDKELVREEGHVTVTEKRKIAPKEEEILLEERGMFYQPIWCVEGVNGVMIINAGTGKIVSEDYYKL